MTMEIHKLHTYALTAYAFCAILLATTRAAECQADERSTASQPAITIAVSADPSELYQQGLALFKAARLREALAHFDEVSKKSSGYLQLCAFNMVGQIHRRENRLPEAISAFDVVVRHAHDMCASTAADSVVSRHAFVLGRLALFYQAEIHEQRRDWNKAIEIYERLAKTESTNDKAKESLFGGGPALFEKLARTYWHVGKHEHAKETWRTLLKRWPEGEQAEAARYTLLALEIAPTTARNQRLAFLACPLTWPERMPAELDSRETNELPSLSNLPDPTLPVQSRLNDIVALLPKKTVWRPILTLQQGWLLFEGNKFEAAKVDFVDAGEVTKRTSQPLMTVVNGYAQLSHAIVLLRQKKPARALQLAQDVADRRLPGHVGRLADNLVASCHQWINTREAVKKCGVQELK